MTLGTKIVETTEISFGACQKLGGSFQADCFQPKKNVWCSPGWFYQFSSSSNPARTLLADPTISPRVAHIQSFHKVHVLQMPREDTTKMPSRATCSKAWYCHLQSGFMHPNWCKVSSINSMNNKALICFPIHKSLRATKYENCPTFWARRFSPVSNVAQDFKTHKVEIYSPSSPP